MDEPVRIHKEDSEEEKWRKAKDTIDDIYSKLSGINDSVYDFNSSQTVIQYVPQAIEADEVDTDVASHEATYDHDDLHTRKHSMDGSSDHTSPSGTENNLVDFDSSGYPVDDSGLSVTNASDAITKKHTRLHDMDDSSDHNSPSGTENNLVDFDASGYPVDDSGLSVTDASDAITKKHTRLHDIDSTSDHTGVSGADENDIIVFDSNALPKSGGATIAEVRGCDTHASGSTNFVLAQQAAEADLNQTITDPPTQAEVQAISDKIDALLAKLRSANVLAT